MSDLEITSQVKRVDLQKSTTAKHEKPDTKPKNKKKNDPFGQKKKYILQQVALTDEEHPDASPKGTIDAPLLPLMYLINKHEDMFTTSSCSGRVSVFLEGDKIVPVNKANKDSSATTEESETREKIGGKGAGGKWLFVTHDPKDLVTEEWLKQVKEYHEENPLVDGASKRYLQYKFEAMVCLIWRELLLIASLLTLSRFYMSNVATRKQPTNCTPLQWRVVSGNQA